MLCATSDGEPLSIMLRRGNAAANNIADHIDVLDAAIEQLPEAVAAGHCASGEAPAPRQVHLRVDAAGCSTHIAQACRQRNIEFFMTARSNDEVTTAIDHNRFDRDTWPGPRRRAIKARPGASSPSSSTLKAGPSAPASSRGASRFTPARSCSTEQWRYRGFYTDADGNPAQLDAHMRAHARIENTIAALKDSGLKRMPFSESSTPTPPGRTRRAQHGAVRWFTTTAPARPTGSSRPQTPQMATARTRPNSALLRWTRYGLRRPQRLVGPFLKARRRSARSPH